MNLMAEVPDLIVTARQVRVLEHARRTPPKTLARSAVQNAQNLFPSAVISSTLPRGFINSILAAAVKKTDDLLSSKHVKTHDCHFRCEIQDCKSRGFYRLQDLNRHMSSRHKNGDSSKFYCTVQECEYATKGFPRKDNCNRHIMKQHHGQSRDDLHK